MSMSVLNTTTIVVPILAGFDDNIILEITGAPSPAISVLSGIVAVISMSSIILTSFNSSACINLLPILLYRYTVPASGKDSLNLVESLSNVVCPELLVSSNICSLLLVLPRAPIPIVFSSLLIEIE